MEEIEQSSIPKLLQKAKLEHAKAKSVTLVNNAGTLGEIGYLGDLDGKQVAAALNLNIGDRVAGWLPNIPETTVAMLATSSWGGVWPSCSPDFGAEGA